MRKKLIAGLLVVMVLLANAGCTQDGEKTDGTEPPSVTISDMDEGTVEVHETLLPLEENGDSYYNRIQDANGNSVYRVKQAVNEEFVNLPTEETVLYTIAEGEAYYEKVTYHYKENGEEKTMSQYQLFVTD